MFTVKFLLNLTTGSSVNPYGCLLLSKFPPARGVWHDFPTKQNRNLTSFEFIINDKRFSIGTVHLESYDKDRPVRKKQFEISFEKLEVADTSILMGKIDSQIFLVFFST